VKRGSDGMPPFPDAEVLPRKEAEKGNAPSGKFVCSHATPFAMLPPPCSVATPLQMLPPLWGPGVHRMKQW
jgi:hypothetical protein